MLQTVKMWPWPCARSRRSTASVPVSGPMKLVEIVRWWRSTDTSRAKPVSTIPALSTRTSRVSNRATVSSSATSQPLCDVTSSSSGRVSGPSLPASSAAAFELMSAITTRSPRPASSSAVAAPMPLAAPVMRYVAVALPPMFLLHPESLAGVAGRTVQAPPGSSNERFDNAEGRCLRTGLTCWFKWWRG